FQKRRAGAVEVNASVAALAAFVVQVLSGILFEVRANDADFLCVATPGLMTGVRPTGINFEPAVVTEGQVVLSNLVVLRQVRVVVVLAVPLGEASNASGVVCNLAVESQRRPQGELERLLVHDRK